jgi:hypothetical protein
MLQVILLFGYGPDAPPRKLFRQKKNLEVDNSTSSDKSCLEDELTNEKRMQSVFSWRPVVLFLFWALLWSSYVLVLCGIYVQQHGGLLEMFKRYCLNTMINHHYLFFMPILHVTIYLDICLCNVSRYFFLVSLKLMIIVAARF